MKSPMSRPKARAALLRELEHAMRRSSALGVIFGQTVASNAGVSSSDLECLDFLNLEGRVTAGRLAEVTGLTTGAITGVVDRLEKAGFVRRARDDNDRRKVFIELVPENIAKIGRFYEHLQRSMHQVWSTYSDAELKLLLRFTTEGAETMLGAVEHLKAMMKPSKGEGAGGPGKGRQKGPRSA
jgi:DNA-binding MarR family transcriptional regulator